MVFRKYVVVFFLLASVSCYATTVAEECQKRAMIAYDKGMTDDQKQKLGASAASECFKEMEESLKKDGGSSATSSGSTGVAIIFLLGIGGFLVYKRASRGDKPLTNSEINSLLGQVREVFRVESGDLNSVRKYKEKSLDDAEKMFSAALTGTITITGNTFKGGIAEIRQDVANFTRRKLEQKSKDEDLIKESTEVLKTGAELLANPIVTAGPDGNPDPAVITALKHRQSDMKKIIEEARARLAEI